MAGLGYRTIAVLQFAVIRADGFNYNLQQYISIGLGISFFCEVLGSDFNNNGQKRIPN